MYLRNSLLEHMRLKGFELHDIACGAIFSGRMFFETEQAGSQMPQSRRQRCSGGGLTTPFILRYSILGILGYSVLEYRRMWKLK